MDEIFEILLELLIESGIEISSNKKISKWIRYPIIIIIVFLFLFITLGMILLGSLLLDESVIGGLFIIIIGIILFVSGINKFRKTYIEIKNK